MSIDLSLDRAVSSRNPKMSMLNLFHAAASQKGLILLWSDKDHRLLRVCKLLCKHNILVKESPDHGATVFRFPPGFDHSHLTTVEGQIVARKPEK